MNTYIQDKLNGLRERYKNSESLNPFIDDIEYYFKESITDYHNHIIEKIEKLSKNAEKFVPYQKIHYQSALIDLKSLLQDTNPKE